MRVLVTGGAGYIGSISVRMLLDAGHSVTVLDSLERGHRAAVDSRARLVVGDIGDSVAVIDALAGVDVVLHCAGYIEVAESVVNPARYFDNNVAKPAVLLEEMGRAGIGAIVFSSTAAVYGNPDEAPITERHPIRPINPYGQSKSDFEQLLDRWDEGGGTSVRFRYFNVAGAWPDGSMGEAHHPESHIVPRVLGMLASGSPVEIFGSDYQTGDGTCIRDYVHVCDIATAHLLACEALRRGEEGGIYNLGNGGGYSNLEVVSACAKSLALSLGDVSRAIRFRDRRLGDPAVLVADATAAESRFGWQPRYPDLDVMVSHATAWHTRHPRGYES